MLDLLIVLICLSMNAVFSAYEMAFITVERDGIDELKEKDSSLTHDLLRFKERPERTLSIIQIGITLVGAIAAAVGGTGAVENLEPLLLNKFELSTTAAEAIAVTVVIIPLTYLSVVFGELVPKTIALRHPIKVLRFATKMILVIDKILSPIVTFLEISTSKILKLTGQNQTEIHENISETVDIGNLPDYHRKFVHNLISLKNTKIEKVMRPWSKVESLSFSLTDDEVEEKVSSSTHSRFPVIDEDVLVGIFHWKEWDKTDEISLAPWQSILAAALEVRSDEKVLDVFLKMQKGNFHIAVVNDKNGKRCGLVSIEDVVESIVGNIKDDLERNRVSRILSRRTKINL